MHHKLKQMYRIIAPLINSILDYGMWSDSHSGHFTQFIIIIVIITTTTTTTNCN